MKKRQVFEFTNNSAGQNAKLKLIDKMEVQEIVPSSFSPCTGVMLLILCFPLVLFGYNKGKIIVTFVKEE